MFCSPVKFYPHFAFRTVCLQVMMLTLCCRGVPCMSSLVTTGYICPITSELLTTYMDKNKNKKPLQTVSVVLTKLLLDSPRRAFSIVILRQFSNEGWKPSEPRQKEPHTYMPVHMAGRGEMGKREWLNLPLLGVPSSFNITSSTAFWFFRSTFWNEGDRKYKRKKERNDTVHTKHRLFTQKNTEAHETAYAHVMRRKYT